MSLPWKVHAHSPTPLGESLSRSLGLHPIVASILERRGIGSPEEAERFLCPSLNHLHDPFLLKGMDAAVAALDEALREGRRIVISGDYDVDGITSSTLLVKFLRDAGCRDVDVFIPNRFDHGYGLTPRTVEALLERKPQLIVTVDNGITAVDEVARLRAEGIATIVTDHHLPRSAGVPAGIVVNPQQPGCGYPFKGISGCGVAFKLVTALRKRLREAGWWSAERPEPNLKALLDLVAVGTVADVSPLVEENRVLVYHGLEVMNRPGLRPGFAALLAYGRPEPVTARTLAFRVAPRLNAAGRMSDGTLGVRLLLAGETAEAVELAGRLEEQNTARRHKSAEMLEEAQGIVGAEATADDPGIVVKSEAFHEGVIGITAARLVEIYHRPVVVLAENADSFKGSARSLPGVNLAAVFEACADLLSEHGGHAAAAGCRIPKENLAAFRQRFAEACARLADHAEPPAEEMDATLDPAAIPPDLVEQLQRLEPFGQQNPEPSFLVESHGLPEPRPFGRGHLKWPINGGAEMVAWGAAERAADATAGARYRVRLGFNEYRGNRKVQLTVDEFRPPSE